MKQIAVIYIPGLGDTKITNQQRAVNTWRWWGVKPYVCHMKWANNEDWYPKLQRLLDMIDDLHGRGMQVALVGASAGAAAAINALAARQDKIVACVLIAGKVNRPQSIGEYYRKRHPAFITCVYNSEKLLKTIDYDTRKRILSRYALADETVYKPDSRIAGAKNQVVWSIGHVPTIALQLTVGAPGFVRFIKQQTRRA